MNMIRITCGLNLVTNQYGYRSLSCLCDFAIVHNVHREAKVVLNHMLCDLYFDSNLGLNLKELDQNFKD